MDPFHPSLLTFLGTVSRQTATIRPDSLAGRRTVYRWHQRLGASLQYRPNVSLAALGILHLHVIVPDNARWRSCALTVGAHRVRNLHLESRLYLDIVIPATMQDAVRTHIEALRIPYRLTGDAWQDTQEFTTWVEHDGRLSPTASAQPPSTYPSPVSRPDLVEWCPLVLPVAIESHVTRHSTITLWRTLYSRLGEHIWGYLPPRSRRYRTNGKHHIVQAQALLEEAGLIRQHRIRYTPIERHTVSVTLLLPHETTLPLVVREASLVIETSTGNGGSVVHLTGDTRLVHALATTTIKGAHVYLHEPDTIVPLPGIRYERLYDPTTRTWHDPRDAL